MRGAVWPGGWAPERATGAPRGLPLCAQLPASCPFLPLPRASSCRRPSLSSLHGPGHGLDLQSPSLPVPGLKPARGDCTSCPVTPFPGRASPRIQDPEFRSKRVAAAPRGFGSPGPNELHGLSCGTGSCLSARPYRPPSPGPAPHSPGSRLLLWSAGRCWGERGDGETR